MGYRVSQQGSLARLFTILSSRGRWPGVNPAIKKVYSNMVDLNDPWTWTKVVEERARLSEKEMSIASINNMAIA
jgi:hypothetical protein